MSDAVYRNPLWTARPEIFSASDLEDRLDWGQVALGIKEIWAKSSGKGILVGVCDTGRPVHPDLAGKVKFSRNFSSSGSDIDQQGHGCIGPTDKVYTSMCGLQDIQTLFERCNGVTHFLHDRSIVKDVSRFGINTLSLENGKTVRKQVLAVHKLPYSGEVIHVRSREFTLMLTPWHPVYVASSRRGKELTIVKKRADALVVGDKVMLSDGGIGVTDTQLKIPLRVRYSCKNCPHMSRGNKRKYCRKCNVRNWLDGVVTTELALNEDLAYWLGLLITGGRVMKNQDSVEFSNKNEKLLLRFTQLCEKLFGKTTQPGDHSVRLNDSDVKRMVVSLGIPVGKKSRSMRLPETIAKSPASVIFSFLAGVFDGNGCASGKKTRIITGSELFANDIMVLLRTLGVRAQVNRTVSKERMLRGRLLKESVAWQVKVGHCSELLSRSATKGYVPPPRNPRRTAAITALSRKKYSGDLYDLTVADAHNYTANGAIVSNTHVCGTIAAKADGKGVVGVAPDADLCIAKVLGDDGSGSNRGVAAGVRYCLENNCDIISMSLGGGYDAEIERAVNEAVAAGVFVICAAGNSGEVPGQNTVGFPARLDQTVAVAAYNKRGEIAKFSSRGKEVDIAFPGEEIVSTWPGGGYRALSGTSMATPYCSGVVALYLELQRAAERNNKPVDNPVRNNADLLRLLRSSAMDKGPTGHDAAWGWGIIDVAKFTELKSTQDVGSKPDNSGAEIDLGLFKARLLEVSGGWTGNTPRAGLFLYI